MCTLIHYFFSGKVFTFPRFTSRRKMEKSRLRWTQSNWRIHVSLIFDSISHNFCSKRKFIFRLLCRRLSILPEEGEDCLSNSSNENWNFEKSNPKNHSKNSFRRTHSEEKDSYSISQQSNSVHQYNKNKFSSKSMDRIAGIVTTSSDSSPSARSTSR